MTDQTDASHLHPLDPLSATEFRAIRDALAKAHGVGPGWRFASVELKEPPKDIMLRWRPGQTVAREAIAVVWNRGNGKAYKARLTLGKNGIGSVASFEHLPGQHPNMTLDEWHDCDELLRSDPGLATALARRGITNSDLVLVDVWAYGAALVPAKYAGRRIGWGDVWYRGSERGNPYAHPVGGLHPIVDLNTMTVLDIEDTPSPGGQPPVMGEYVPDLTGMPLREIKPLAITQPAGVSFRLTGNLLCWQNWELRLGFNFREGLVLHTVGYRDKGQLRSVAHRLSFAEMVVPYRDPSVDHYRRTAFDIGEWGLGFMTQSLELGCDCLGAITYADAVLHDTAGEPRVIKNAICIHEEDNAVLWKHVDHLHGAEVRRMRRLVVSFHVTVANYEYLVYWRFYQDGNIECEVRATGIMVTTSFANGKPSPNGTVVDHNTYAPYHQHFIVARLDLDIDGAKNNTVYRTESFAPPIGPGNPHGLALETRNTPLRTEHEGIQDYNWLTQSGWKVVNDKVRNSSGTQSGYKLVPSGSFPAMIDPASPIMQRAAVIGHTLWVTPYADAERWPAGEFPNLGATDTGMTQWTAADRPIAGADVVLWYVFGIHHITRPEDWPVMPADIVSFWLKPFGFFDRNPALDVPPSPASVSCCD
ncbi:MAG: primary-amine oxidase [Hyphomicrobium sp.]